MSGTLQSGVTYNSDGYFDFDGTDNGYIQLEHESGQYPSGDLTVFAYVKFNDRGTQYNGSTIINVNQAGSSDPSNVGGFDMAVEQDGTLLSRYGTSAGRNDLAGSTVMALDEWHFIAFTRDQSTGVMTQYINDVSTPTDTGTFSTLDIRHDGFGYEDNSEVKIGQWSRGQLSGQHNKFNGSLMGVGIYNRVLTTEELTTVKDTFSAPAGGTLLDGAVANGGTGNTSGSVSFGDWNYGSGLQEANAGTRHPNASVVAEGLKIEAPWWSWGDWWIEPDLTGYSQVRIQGTYTNFGGNYGTIAIYVSDGLAPENTSIAAPVDQQNGSGTFDVTVSVAGGSRITIRTINTNSGTGGYSVITNVDLL